MKNLLFLATFAIGISTASAQNTTQENTTTAATSSTGAKVVTDNKTESAGSGESLVNPSAKENLKPKVQKIPDGSYGSNRTGQIYSPSNPNYPYDQTGNLVRSKNTEITHPSKKQKAVGTKPAALTPAQTQLTAPAITPTQTKKAASEAKK